MTLAEIQRRLSLVKEGTPGPEIVKEDREVVWNGGELLPSRPTRSDDRFKYVPFYDLDEDDAQPVKEKRKYTRTGRHTKLPASIRLENRENDSNDDPNTDHNPATGPGGQAG
jgi:hypothetical protein